MTRGVCKILRRQENRVENLGVQSAHLKITPAAAGFQAEERDLPLVLCKLKAYELAAADRDWSLFAVKNH